MKRAIGLLVVCFILSGCGWANWKREANWGGNQKPSLRNLENANPEIKMEVLDEIPSMGITIIRFIDAGHTRYIAIKNDQISTMSSTKSGKINYDETIQTVK